jgi:N-acetyl-gamma-glutamyl-phosphate reductase
MIRAAIIGASGYTGLELVRLLIRHPKVSLTALTSEKYAGQSFGSVFPSLVPHINIELESLSPKSIAKKADFIFTALPHKEAMDVVPIFIQDKKNVADLSADFRFSNKKTYELWYQQHTAPELLPQAVYGLPELNRPRIKKASLVAIPGCYPTSALIPLIPLFKEEVISPKNLIVDSKSGMTGAGRSLNVASLFSEVSESFKAYNAASHRHQPEMEEQLSEVYGKSVSLTFTPHLVPMNRGILSTIYVDLKYSMSNDTIQSIFMKHYSKEKFIRVFPQGMLPQTGGVRGSNYCDIGFVLHSKNKKLILISAIDNLIKGASGQAVQNMNIMLRFPEETGLEHVPLYP